MFRFRDAMKDKNRKLIFKFSLFIFIFNYFINGWIQHPDSFDYIQALDAVVKGLPWHDPDVAFRPGFIYFSIPLTFVFDNENSLGIQNLIFYILLGQTFYAFAKRLTLNSNVSLCSTLLLISSFPMLYWGLSILNEMGSWFFLTLALLLMIRLFEDKFTFKNFMISSLVLGVGVFYKPTVLPAAIFFTILLFLRRDKFGNFESFNIWIRFALISMIPIILNSVYIYIYWGYDITVIINKAIFGSSGRSSELSGLKYSMEYKFLTILIAFPFLPLLLFIRKEILAILRDYVRNPSLGILISCFFMIVFLSLRTATPRYTFLLFPIFYIWLGILFDHFLSKFHYKTGINRKVALFCTIFILTIFNVLIIANDNLLREAIGLWKNNV